MRICYLGVAFSHEGLDLIRLWPWHQNGIDGKFFAPDFMAIFETILEATKYWRQYQRDCHVTTHENPLETSQTGFFNVATKGHASVPSHHHSYSLLRESSFFFKGIKRLLTCRTNEVSEDTKAEQK